MSTHSSEEDAIGEADEDAVESFMPIDPALMGEGEIHIEVTASTPRKAQQDPDAESSGRRLRASRSNSQPESSSHLYDSPNLSETQYDGCAGFQDDEPYNRVGQSSSRNGANYHEPPSSSSRPQRTRQKTTSSIGSARPEVEVIKIKIKKDKVEERSTKKKAVKRDKDCSFCLGTDYRNREGNAEEMLSCRLCGKSGHPSCLGMETDELLHKVRTYPWQCIECKICEICQVKGNDNRLMFCDGCDRGWHCYCLNPPIDKPPKGIWKCPKCQSEAPTSTLKRSHHSYSNTAAHANEDEDTDFSPGPSQSKKKPKLGNGIREGSGSNLAKRMKHLGNDFQGGYSPSPSESVKRNKHKTASPGFSIQKSSGPTTIRLRIPLPSISPNKRRGKGKSGQSEDEATGPPSPPFGGVITGADADTKSTAIGEKDKEAFERSRRAAEIKLGTSGGDDYRDRSTTPDGDYGASSAASPSGPTSPDSQSTPVNAFRPLRDRLLLNQSMSMNNSSEASLLLAGTSTRPGLAPSSSLGGAPATVASRIKRIRFGKYDIDTWYSAPYPEEYSRVPDGRLWLCEFCLKYMKSGFVADRHEMKCKARHPPGDEIYRDGNVSVFEVDGRKNKIYCQNLCLLAKMFLDHKTLYYDVEPFLFYVMTEVDDGGARFVGYFSKEKRSPHYNVSCIMTLPIRQRQGWGNLLIDFSYLLSKKEGRPGSPEKPLSALGALSYEAYWTSAIYRFFHSASTHVRISLEEISNATSMTLEDVVATLQKHGFITVHSSPKSTRTSPIVRRNRAASDAFTSPGDGFAGGVARQNLSRNNVPLEKSTAIPTQYDIHWNHEAVQQYINNARAKGYLELHAEKLKYTPFLVTRVKLGEGAVRLARAMDMDIGKAVDGPSGLDGVGINGVRLEPGPPKEINAEEITTQTFDAQSDASNHQVPVPMTTESTPDDDDGDGSHDPDFELPEQALSEERAVTPPPHPNIAPRRTPLRNGLFKPEAGPAKGRSTPARRVQTPSRYGIDDPPRGSPTSKVLPQVVEEPAPVFAVSAAEALRSRRRG